MPPRPPPADPNAALEAVVEAMEAEQRGRSASGSRTSTVPLGAPVGELAASFDSALGRRPDARLDNTALRRLGSLLHSPHVAVAQVAAFVAARAAAWADEAAKRRRAEAIIGADGAAVGLCKALQGVDAPWMVNAIDFLVQLLLSHDGDGPSPLLPSLLGAAPGLPAAVVFALGKFVPAEAAREVGLPPPGRLFLGLGVAGQPGPSLAEHVLIRGSMLLRLMLWRAGPIGPHLMSPAMMPTLVAALSFRDRGGEMTSTMLLSIAHLMSSFGATFLASQLFKLGACGLLRGLERACGRVAGDERRAAKWASMEKPGAEGAFEVIGTVVFFSLFPPLKYDPKRLAGASAAAWADATPRLVRPMGRMAEALEGRPELLRTRLMLTAVVKGLQMLRRWREASLELCREAGTLAAAPAAEAPAGPDDGGGGGGGGDSAAASCALPTLVRRCAGCGKTSADDEGVRLYRCRGCGPLTGVMYCGVECARAHWVKGGHRRVCERGQAALVRLAADADMFGVTRRGQGPPAAWARTRC